MTADRAFKQAVRARMARTGERYSTARRHLLSQMGASAMPSDTQLEQVRVERLVKVPVQEDEKGRVDPIFGQPMTMDHNPAVLVRATEDPNRSTLIFIGAVEAFAILAALQHLELPRPMTHDLLTQTIARLGAATRIEIELREGIYYATIEVEASEGDATTLDARPSDAFAIALRCDPQPTIWMPPADLHDIDSSTSDLEDWTPELSSPSP